MAEITWHGEQIAARLHDAELVGLRLAAEHLLQTSSVIVPHEEGDLERSGDVDVDDATAAASVYYDRPYARSQHEDLTLRHDDGRQAKYLEQPMTTERDTLLAIIAKQASKAFE